MEEFKVCPEQFTPQDMSSILDHHTPYIPDADDPIKFSFSSPHSLSGVYLHWMDIHTSRDLIRAYVRTAEEVYKAGHDWRTDLGHKYHCSLH